RSITIRGTVIAADDTLPIIGAMVRLNAADSAKIGLKGRTVLSDVNGKFTLASREKKNNVTISFIGYTTTTVPVPAPDSRGVVNLG
ncbi:MAG: carboxypeptidase regulatory-like domain-containing protein, partial [Mucinivorans sp.]